MRTETLMLNVSPATRLMFEVENARLIDLRMALFKPRPVPEAPLIWPEPARMPFLKISALRSNPDPWSSLSPWSSSLFCKATQMLAWWLGVVVAVGVRVGVAVRVAVTERVTVGVLVGVEVGVCVFVGGIGVLVGVPVEVLVGV